MKHTHAHMCSSVGVAHLCVHVYVVKLHDSVCVRITHTAVARPAVRTDCSIIRALRVDASNLPG